MDTQTPNPTDIAGAITPIETVNACPSCCCGQGDVSGVGHDRLDHSADAELDKVIADLGDRMMAAMKAGDRTGAAIYLDRMEAAIGSRSPEHKARREARIQAAIDGDPCYFSAMGEHDAKGQAA